MGKITDILRASVPTVPLCMSGIAAMLGVLTAPAQKQPNILLLVSDDHSAFAMGCDGNPDVKTPNIDRLASQGVRFSRCYAASPQSVLSRASIMTGRTPVAVNMSRFSVPLARRYRTFPEDLREAGYYTGLAGRGYHLDGPVSGITGRPGRIRIVADYYKEHDMVTFPDRVDTCMVVIDAIKGETHGQSNRQFHAFMESRDKDKPFFLQLCYADPHTPYDAPSVHDPASLTLPPYYPDTDGVRRHLAAYYDEVNRLDSDIGEILDYLDTSGLAENTIVMFTGDNGGAQFMGKGTLYDPGIRVPMIIRWPGHIAPGVCDAVVSNMDISATCLDVSGVKPSSEMEGVSFLRTIAGGTPADRYVFSQRANHGTNALPHDTSCFDQQRCIVGERYKLIYNILPQEACVPVDVAAYPHFVELKQMNDSGLLAPEFSKLYFSPTRPMFELYDIEADPYETVNLFDNPDMRDVRDNLVRRLTYKMIDDEDFCALPHPVIYEKR